jgi:hypothetical protein
MAVFQPGVPIETREPTIVVDEGLPAGAHRFQLQVFDDSGIASRPDVATVQIRGRIPPRDDDRIVDDRIVNDRIVGGGGIVIDRDRTPIR